MVGLRPVLIPSREADPVEQIRFGDGVILIVAGHGAAVELGSGVGNPSALGLAPRRVAAPSVCAGETIGESVPRGAYTS